MNTEQFDGHTPAPWKTSGYDVQAIKVWTVDGLDETQNWIQVPKADRLLAAAAPDLLAEVKRLRLIVHELLKDADHDTHIWFHSNGWCEDLRQPCTVCDSKSDCGQSLITPQ